MLFEVGQRVRMHAGIYAGYTGEITLYDTNRDCPYSVLEEQGGHILFCKEEELADYNDRSNVVETREQRAAIWLEKRLVQMHEEEIIRCPNPECKKEFEQGEPYYDYITYNGEEGPQDAVCVHCNCEFYVIESVDRTYKSYKTLEEAEE